MALSLAPLCPKSGLRVVHAKAGGLWIGVQKLGEFDRLKLRHAEVFEDTHVPGEPNQIAHRSTVNAHSTSRGLVSGKCSRMARASTSARSAKHRWTRPHFR